MVNFDISFFNVWPFMAPQCLVNMCFLGSSARGICTFGAFIIPRAGVTYSEGC